ncbi:MAG: PIN domain-containing protein [Verrucomicrobiota bacterium]
MRYLLDTDTCIAALRGDPAVIALVSRWSPAECVVSTVTVYELEVGVAKCRDPRRERAKVARFLGTVRVAPFDHAAARVAAGLRAGLEARGEGIGPYNTLLAGQALAGGLAIVTGNRGEYGRVPGLEVIGLPSTGPR